MIADFSKYNGTILEIYNIGWLDKKSNYKNELMDSGIIDKLKKILERERVNLMRGIEYCSLCPRVKGKIHVQNSGTDNELLLGISEIWLPSVDKTKVFASPDLIIHYIEEHLYLPPQEYIDAVNEFDINSDWSGEKTYNDYEQAKFG